MMRSLLLIALFVGFSSFGKDKPEVTLAEISLFNKTVKLKVPKEFKQIDDGKIKKLYPGLPKTRVVYANADNTVRIALGSDDLLLKEQALPAMTTMMKGWLKGSVEKSKWKDEGVTDVSGTKVGYLEYIKKKPEQSYEFMFFTLSRGQMLSCSIHAPKKGNKFWRDIANQIMNSLILVKGKD